MKRKIKIWRLMTEIGKRDLRVKRKQREFLTTSICRRLPEEIILDSIMWQGRQICKDLVEGVVMHDSWEIMEMNRIITEIGKGGGERKRAVEDHLRDETETEEAAKMIMMEEDKSSRRKWRG